MGFSKKLLFSLILAFSISGCNESVLFWQVKNITQNLSWDPKREHIFENISIDRNKALLPIELPCVYSFTVKVPLSILKQYKMYPKPRKSKLRNYQSINIPISVDITVYNKNNLVIYEGLKKRFVHNGITIENGEPMHWFSFSLDHLKKQQYYITTHANVQTDISFFQHIDYAIEDERCTNK